MADNSFLLTIPQLINSVQGHCLCGFSVNNGFSSVATDSRNVVEGSLFIPLIGEFQDGHLYIPNAVEAGASVVLIDNAHHDKMAEQLIILRQRKHVCIIVVKNTLLALQDAARFYVSLFPDLLKIGITGSSGKTTTKEIIGSIFSQKYCVVMNEGNLNSETGLPLSVFRIRKEHDVGIFELGMNRRGEIAEITGVLSPSLALITNIGTAHIGILGTKQAIAEEKKAVFSFFTNTCAGFVPENDPYRKFLSQVQSGRIFAFGPTETSGYSGSENLGIDGTMIGYEDEKIHFPLPGIYNLNNALGAISLSRFAGLSPKEIKKGLENVKPLFGRAEVIRGKYTILFDCYNANPDSMQSALEFCSNLEWIGKKIFVLATMLELGEESKASHQKVCQIASETDADAIFLFGDEIIEAGRTVEWGNKTVQYFDDIVLLSSALQKTVITGDLIFLKGSRGMALERVCDGLDISINTEAVHV